MNFVQVDTERCLPTCTRHRLFAFEVLGAAAKSVALVAVCRAPLPKAGAHAVHEVLAEKALCAKGHLVTLNA